MISNQLRNFATRVGVLGAGQMGTGIGIVSSRVAQYDVVYIDPNSAQLKKSEDFVKSWCAKELKKEKMTAAD
jgi:3-hydroxybutyryl-CoA dehydrogenase